MAAYLLESAFCLACFYAFYHLALRRETFFQWSRAYLLVTPLLAMVLPALNIRLDRSVEIHSADVSEMPSEITEPTSAILPLVEQVQSSPVALHRYDWSQPVAAGWSVSLADALWWLYGAGAIGLLVLLAVRFGRLFWMLHRCRHERQGTVTFATSDVEEVPLASFFGFIFWNKNAQLSESQQFLLEHELVHVRQRHSLDVLLMEMMVVLQWFNPLMHTFRRSLCAVHEYIADDYVVRHTRQRRAYATLLVQQAAAGTRAPSGSGLVNTFHSLIKQRLIMLAKRPSRPLRRAKFALALPLAAGLMLLFSFRLVETLPAAAPLRAAIESAANYVATLSEVTIAAEKPRASIVAAVPEPTPYIFYWGQFQSAILFDPATGAYSSQVVVTPANFRASVQREPRIWDGSMRTMMSSCEMHLHSFTVRSNFGSPDTYAGTLKAVNDFAYAVQPGESVWITELTLPNGKKATIEINIESNSDYSGPSRQLVYNNSTAGSWVNTSSPEHKSWGKAIWDYASVRDFITEREFWALIKQSPVFVASDDSLAVGKRALYVTPAEGDPFEFDIVYDPADPAGSARINMDKLSKHADQLKPGSKIYFQSGIKIKNVTEPGKEIETMTGVAQLRIVMDDDPRLPLGRPYRKYFSFEWGKLSRTVGEFYGISETGKDGTALPADMPMRLTHYEMGLPDLLKMFDQTPHLWRISEQLSNPHFNLEYKDLKAQYDSKNGLVPADFVAKLKSRMKPGEELVLSDFQASDADLRSLKIVLIPHDGVLPPALPPATTPAAQYRFLTDNFTVSPNPATERVVFRFVLPEAGHGTLRITNTLGQEVYSLETDFEKGAGSYPLATRDLKAKGTFFATLEMPFGKTTLTFVVQ